jgi:hypothetical protein
VALAVAAQLLDLREEPGVGLAAVEERDLVAGRRLDERAADEERSAENEKSQSEPIASRRRSTSSSVL